MFLTARRLGLGLGLLATPACFSPDGAAGDTEDGSTGATESVSTSAGPTSTDTESTSTTDGTTGPTTTTTPTGTVTGTETGTETTDPTTDGESSSSTGEDPPDWGEGEPPDFGDLGDEGDGAVLVTHALDLDEAVDVWLVGDTEPFATDLAPRDAVLLEAVPRDVRRVVLARAGTTEAVACSDWFPLRADTQWATVAARAEHGCATPSNDGATVTFEQALALTGSQVRYVHAAAPDDFTLAEDGAPQAGALEPLDTLTASALPDCNVVGCFISYALEAAELNTTRHFSFLTNVPADIPPPGEVMFVVLGDVRQEWPTEPDTLQLLRVDIDGSVRLIERDPDLAVVSPFADNEVEFRLLTPPTTTTFATAEPCGFGTCPLEAQRFRPGNYDFTAVDLMEPTAMGSFDLIAGHRYILFAVGGEFVMLTDEFDRGDATIAVGRAYNFEETSTLTLGREFGGNPQAFAAMTDIPAQTLSAETELPAGGWSMLSALDGGALGVSCFYGVTTEANWRGFLGPFYMVSLDTWPPNEVGVNLACF